MAEYVIITLEIYLRTYFSMNKNHILFVLGADRVGKSTLVNRIKTEMNKEINIHIFHFSGPQPHHNSPTDQYLIPLNQTLNKIDQTENNTNLFLCDRGGAEVCFYEKYRRHIRIDQSWAQTFESWAAHTFLSFTTIFIEKHFDEIESRHIQEIDQLYPDCSPYWRLSQLASRENEHNAYYDYMYEYLNNQSLCSRIIYLDDNSDLEVQKIADLITD